MEGSRHSPEEMTRQFTLKISLDLLLRDSGNLIRGIDLISKVDMNPIAAAYWRP